MLDEERGFPDLVPVGEDVVEVCEKALLFIWMGEDEEASGAEEVSGFAFGGDRLGKKFQGSFLLAHPLIEARRAG